MKLGKCQIENFGSYKSLEFNFSNLGLSLVHGPTGSGKSTLIDAVYWCLFGITTRGGTVEDIKSWSNPDSITKGCLDVTLLNGVKITIVRSRGKPSQNDLYWISEDDGAYNRGKDLKDTQAFLTNLLGVDADLYLNAACLTEFSATGSFFTAQAKARRELFEKIADLSFPITLSLKSTEAKKKYSKEINDLEKQLSGIKGALEGLPESLAKLDADSDLWRKRSTEKQLRIQQLSDSFEETKAMKIKVMQSSVDRWDLENNKVIAEVTKEIRQLSKEILKGTRLETELQALETISVTTCDVCQQPVDSYQGRKAELKELLAECTLTKHLMIKARQQQSQAMEALNPYLSSLEDAKNSINTYKDQLVKEEDPFVPQMIEVEKRLSALKASHGFIVHTLKTCNKLYTGSTQLYSLSIQMRGILIEKAVKAIEEKCNYYLSKYFDSEFKIDMQSEEDNINLNIYKNSYSCNFKQLSKGQRGLLKLCFAAAVQLVSANNAGIHFDTLFFDESLDGLDTELKLKAFGLFSELALSHNSVLVIDHATEFQNLFQNQFEVTLVGDTSRITSHESQDNEA